MKKAIKSKYTESVTVVERADWSIRFYDVETGRHYARRVWYPVHGSDIYVQHRGGFYSIATEFKGKYDPQAISRYEAVSAEELETMTAEIIAHRAGIQYAAALTWEEATRVYAYAIVCNDADTEATMADIVSGILQDRSKQPTQQAAYHVAAVDIIPETERPAGYAEASADDRATVSDIVDTITRAEIIAKISDPAEREHIAHEADRYQWTPEETRENIEYRATIRAANHAAAAFVAAYAEASGESLTKEDDETAAAYLVARAEIAGSHASAYDRAMVRDMLEAIADAAARQAAFKAWNQNPHRTSGELVEAMDNPRAAFTDPEPEPAPVYQRYELEAYLGDPDAYDVEAIEAEATAYDPKSGARVWSAFGEDLAAIAERHELYEYAPAV